MLYSFLGKLVDQQSSLIPSPPDMADRRARSGGKPSVRVVVSSLEATTKSSASQTNVTFRPQQSGCLGQSVGHMPSKNASDVPFDLPDLLEISDNDNDNDDEEEDEGDVLENRLFGTTEHTIPEMKAPVSMCTIILINCSSFKMYI
jgi:hypothetical protein